MEQHIGQHGRDCGICNKVNRDFIKSMTQVKGKIYADIIYSHDDAGYYVSVFDHRGKDIKTSDIFPDRLDAADWVNVHYPEANTVTFNPIT